MDLRFKQITSHGEDDYSVIVGLDHEGVVWEYMPINGGFWKKLPMIREEENKSDD